MVQIKHLEGLQGDFDRQLRETKKMGGASDALKRMKKRPEGNYHAVSRVKDIKVELCEECGQQAGFRSVVNGVVEYQLCKDCFNKRI